MKFLFLFLFPLAAFAQSVPNGTITQGEVWTPAQWNYAWQSKQDYPIPSGGIPFSALPPIGANTIVGSVGGGTMGALTGVSLGNLSMGGLAPAATNTWLYATGTLSGTGAFAVTPLRGSPLWVNYKDQIAYPNLGVGSTGLGSMMELYSHLENGWDGFRVGAEIFTAVNAPPVTICLTAGNAQTACNSGSATQVQQTNVNGMRPYVQLNTNMGGIPGSWGGADGNTFGQNPSITASALTTNLSIQNGGEIDVNSQAISGPPAEKHSFSFSLTGFCSSGYWGAGSNYGCSSEAPALFNDSALDFTTGDNFGTSFWDTILNCGSYGHSGTCNYATTFIGAHRHYLNPQAAYAQPTFRQGIGLNDALFVVPSSHSVGTLTAASSDTANTMVTVTFGSYSDPTYGSAPPPGSIISISGSNVPLMNGNFIVSQSSTTQAGFTSPINVSAYNGSSATATITTPQGYGYATPGAAIDPNGIMYGSTLVAGPNGLLSETATIATILPDPEPFGGYVGGAYFPGGASVTVNVAAPAGAVAPSGTVTTTYRLNAALLMTSATSFLASTAPTTANPNGASVSTNCSASETLTITGTGGATILVTTSGTVPVSAVITNPGSMTTIPTSGAYTTTGTCTTPLSGWLQLGYGIVSVSYATPGTGYPCLPPPSVYTSGFQTNINSHAHLIAQMTCSKGPLTINPGSISAASWGVNGLALGAHGTQNLTDTTATDSATTLAASAFPVYNFLCTTGPCTTTNLASLYIPVPTNTDGNFSSATLYSLFANGNVKFAGTLNVGALQTDTAGLTVSGATVTLNATANNVSIANGASASGTVAILGGTGTPTGLVHINDSAGTGSTTIGGAANVTNMASFKQQLNGKLWISTAAPTIGAGFGSTASFVPAFNTTKAFVIQATGTGQTTTTALSAFAGASTQWICNAQDLTTAITGRQTTSGTATVTITWSAAPTANDFLLFQCDAI